MDVRAQEKLFKKLFSPKSLFDVYTERFSKSAAKGLDRINGMQYSNRARKELKKVSEKCLNGSFREGANKQVISSQADSLIKISRIWADFFPANTSNQPI
ncbi:hypothetical protein P4G35_00470 [Klebsiella pneumoniae]